MTGVADHKLHQLRIQATKAEGRLPRGAVAYLRVRATRWGARRDPAGLVAKEAARSWAMCAVDPTKALPRAVLAHGWKTAEMLLERQEPSASAVSPADALRLTMARAGITMPSAFEMQMPTGEVLDLRWLGPALVAEVVGRTARWAEDAKALPARSAWGGPVHWRHIEELMAEEEQET